MRVPRRNRPASLVFVILLGIFPFAVASAQESGTSLTVDLKEYGDSGFSGTAVLTESSDGGVHVSMTLTGAELAGNHPTHIHTGTCANFDPNPLYPLETVNLSPVDQSGVSETDVTDTDIATLKDGEYVILVHESPEALTNYLVCGDISMATVGSADVSAATGGTTQAHHMPVAGVGVGALDDASLTAMPIVFGTLAAMSALAAASLRWSKR